MKKESLIFIEHILENINEIESFIKGISEKSFLENKEKQYAVIRAIEVIGEAVKNVPNSFRKEHPEIQWTKIAGMRDKLMHHYFGINLNTIWRVIKDDIPKLKEDVQKIKKNLIKKNLNNS